MGFDFSQIHDDSNDRPYEIIVVEILKELLLAEKEDTEAIAEQVKHMETLLSQNQYDSRLENELMQLVQVLIEKVELVNKTDSIYQFNDKFDTLPQHVALHLLRETASTEYNLKRGCLDTRLDSRLFESNLADIFKQLKGVNPTEADGYKYYRVNDNAFAVIIPMEKWIKGNIHVNEASFNKTVYLFVNETGTFTTIAGQRFVNPETIVFRGVFKSTAKGNLTLENPRLEIPV